MSTVKIAFLGIILSETGFDLIWQSHASPFSTLFSAASPLIALATSSLQVGIGQRPTSQTSLSPHSRPPRALVGCSTALSLASLAALQRVRRTATCKLARKRLAEAASRVALRPQFHHALPCR